MDEKEALAAAQSAEAINAQKNAAEAIERARAAQQEVGRLETTRALADALRQVFGENTDAGRFVNVSHIPLICKNIESIHDALNEIKGALKDGYVKRESFGPLVEKVEGLSDNQKWVTRLVMGAVITAIMGLVLMTR